MNWSVLPPSPGKCRICAAAHPEEDPHDATTFYYRMLFVNSYGRSPTWRDAMMHCEQNVQEKWIKHLTSIGINVDSTQLIGDIKSEADLKERMDKNK